MGITSESKLDKADANSIIITQKIMVEEKVLAVRADMQFGFPEGLKVSLGRDKKQVVLLDQTVVLSVVANDSFDEYDHPKAIFRCVVNQDAKEMYLQRNWSADEIRDQMRKNDEDDRIVKPERDAFKREGLYDLVRDTMIRSSTEMHPNFALSPDTSPEYTAALENATKLINKLSRKKNEREIELSHGVETEVIIQNSEGTSESKENRLLIADNDVRYKLISHLLNTFFPRANVPIKSIIRVRSNKFKTQGLASGTLLRNYYWARYDVFMDDACKYCYNVERNHHSASVYYQIRQISKADMQRYPRTFPPSRCKPNDAIIVQRCNSKKVRSIRETTITQDGKCSFYGSDSDPAKWKFVFVNELFRTERYEEEFVIAKQSYQQHLRQLNKQAVFLSRTDDITVSQILFTVANHSESDKLSVDRLEIKRLTVPYIPLKGVGKQDNRRLGEAQESDMIEDGNSNEPVKTIELDTIPYSMKEQISGTERMYNKLNSQMELMTRTLANMTKANFYELGSTFVNSPNLPLCNNHVWDRMRKEHAERKSKFNY
jgi:hypothetical protein